VSIAASSRGDGSRRRARRKPQVVVVDEVAHTISGNEERKRYVDVLDLAPGGNQRIGAFNISTSRASIDIVQKATGVVVRETVPTAS